MMIVKKSRALLPGYHGGDEDGLPSTLALAELMINHINKFVGMLVVGELKINHFRPILGQSSPLFFKGPIHIQHYLSHGFNIPVVIFLSTILSQK